MLRRLCWPAPPAGFTGLDPRPGLPRSDARIPCPQERRRPGGRLLSTRTAPPSSAVERGADQVAELGIIDAGSVGGSQVDRALACLEVRVPSGETGVLALVPSIDRQAMLPRADEEPAPSDLVGGNPVREHHRGVWMRLEDQHVKSI